MSANCEWLSSFRNVPSFAENGSTLKNYSAGSVPPFIGMVTEKVVFNQISNYLNFKGNFGDNQSGFCQHHSAKTALIKL